MWPGFPVTSIKSSVRAATPIIIPVAPLSIAAAATATAIATAAAATAIATAATATIATAPTATAIAAAPTATATWAFLTRARFVYRQRTSIKILAVEVLYGLAGLVVIRHLNEAETA